MRIAYFAAVSCAAALLPFCSGAAVFPDPVAGNDISSAEAWGGVLPGASEDVVFSGGRNLTVTAKRDVKFGKLVNALKSGYAYTLTFDLRNVEPVPTLTFGGYQPGEAANKWNDFVEFKGGIYNFSHGEFGMGVTFYGHGRSIVVSDGAILTNISDVVLGWTAQERLRMDVRGNSKVFIDGLFKFTNNKTKPGNENYLKLSGGSKMEVNGQFLWDDPADELGFARNQPDGAFHCNDYVELSGTGTSLELNFAKDANGGTGYNCFGRQGGSATIVKDGASLSVKGGAILWDGYTRNNLLRVANATWCGQSVFCGWRKVPPGLGHNRVEVLEDGVLTAEAFTFGSVGSSGNTLLISNGTFSVTMFRFGDMDESYVQYATNNTIVLQGPKARFETGDANFMLFTSPHCELRVEDGAALRPRVSSSFFRYRSGGHHCTLRLRNGGIFHPAEQAFSTSATYFTQDVIAWNNRLVAESGSVVSGGYFNVQGRECEVRIDNSTMVMTNALLGTDSLIVGYSYEYGGIGTNCLLSVAGASPRIELAKGLSVRGCSEVRIELPAGGYADGVVPLTAGGAVVFEKGSRLVLEGAREMSLAHTEAGKRCSYVLFENPQDAVFLSDETIAQVNGEIGEYAVLSKRTAGGVNQAVLRVRTKKITSIVVR